MKNQTVEKLPTTGLVKGPISVALLEEFQRGQIHGGAVASFFGVIRADKLGEGQVVEAIEYSAYREMAERILQEMRAEMMEKHELIDLLILHTVGVVKAGESSMLVALVSKHRQAAFDALRETVERIKADAPVWKKEIFTDGAHRWVGSSKQV